METTLNNYHVVELALTNKVTSENLTQVLDTEEFIMLENLLNASEHLFLESLLFSYADKFEITDEYKRILTNKKQNEEYLISKTVSKIRNTVENMPREVQDFLAFYTLESLELNSNIISEEISKFLNNPKNINFLDDLENELGLKDPVLAINLLKAIKFKYADVEEYYYINSLIWQSKYISLGFLYIFLEV